MDRVPIAVERPDMLVFNFFTFFSSFSSGLPSGICAANPLSSVRPLFISETFVETVPSVLLSDVIPFSIPAIKSETVFVSNFVASTLISSTLIFSAETAALIESTDIDGGRGRHGYEGCTEAGG